jgi:hypothetical protein
MDPILSERLNIFDPKDQVVIAKDIDKAVARQNFFAAMTGSNSNAIIKTSLAPAKAGIVTVKLRDRLKGKGVKDNTDFETNRDQMNYLSQDVYVGIFGNSLRSDDKRFHEYRDGFDFASQSSEALTEWQIEQFERKTYANVSNNLTNVACAKANGTLWALPSAGTIESMCAQITADDVPTVASIRRALTRARLGINQAGKSVPPLRPYKNVVSNLNGIDRYQKVFIVLLDSFGCASLKEDAEWKDMQKEAGIRGYDNSLFTGQLGYIDGSIVIDADVWNEDGAGVMSCKDAHESYITKGVEQVSLAKYAGTGSVETSIGLILGATAMVLPIDDGFKLYVDDTLDNGRKASVAIDRLLGIAKAKYIGVNEAEQKSIYHNQDLSVMGFVYARKGI